LIPDCIGHCRSDGRFTFKNCIRTIYECEDFFNGKISGYDFKENKKMKIKTEKIILIGSSWGGSMVPFVDKYRKSSISHLGLIKAVTDWKTQGKTDYPEESINDIEWQLNGPYKNIYRGFTDSQWPQIFAGDTEFNPIDNINLLNKKWVYVIHGSKDKSVHWSKSKVFYKKLVEVDTNVEAKWKLLRNGTHSMKTNILGFEEILSQLMAEEGII